MSKIVLIGITLFCAIILGVAVDFYLHRPKLAYVRSQDLIARFSGTIEARKAFEALKSQMLANADSLEYSLKTKMEYDRSESLRGRQLAENATIARLTQDNLIQYRNAVEAEIEEKDRKMMEGVLAQVNTYIEEFAIENGYDLILGTTLSGSLLYARNELDITEELLSRLNQKYLDKKE